MPSKNGDNEALKRKAKAPKAEAPPKPMTGASIKEVVPPGGNGIRPSFPGGTAALFGVEESDRGGQTLSPAREFMTAHTDNMQRLLAEAVLSKDMITDLVLLEAEEQSVWGYVNMPSIARMRVACTIGENGRGRSDGVKVETMSPQSIFSKARGWAGKLFGAGGGQEQMGSQPQPPME